MQEIFKAPVRFFAIFFIFFILVVSLPVIYHTGDFLMEHLKTAYWNERVEKKAHYQFPQDKISPPACYERVDGGENTAKLPERPLIVRDAAKRDKEKTTYLFTKVPLFSKIKARLSPFIIKRKEVEDEIVEAFPFRYEFSECNMVFKKLLGIKRPVDDEDLFLLSNGMLAMSRKTDDCKAALYYAELSKNIGSKFFVVIEPMIGDFMDCGRNIPIFRQSDLRLEKSIASLKNNGVELIDLRDFFKKQNTPVNDIFFKGDHHWKTEAALSAAEYIADSMNRCYKTSYDLRYFKKEYFLRERFRRQFIGSLAKKAGVAYSGKMEDFIVYRPVFKTNFTISYMDSSIRSCEGDFKVLLNYKQVYNHPLESNPYAVFMDGDKHFVRITNNYCRKAPKVVFLKNSFANAMIPYFALQTSEIIVLDERHLPMKKIIEILVNERPDIIIYLNSSFDDSYKQSEENF